MAVDRPVLVLACSENKLDGRHPVNQLYIGPLWQSYRRTRRTLDGTDEGPLPCAEVYVLSAKHGLVYETIRIGSYEQRLEPVAVPRLAARVRDQVEISDMPGIHPALRHRWRTGLPVVFVGSKLYQRVLVEAAFEVLPLAPSGGWGDKRKALNAWLSECLGGPRQVPFDLFDAISRAEAEEGR